MQFTLEISIGDVLTFLGLIIAAWSLWYAGKEVHKNALSQRATFLLEATERYFSDDEIRKFYYRLDYRTYRFSIDSDFIGSNEERWLDSLIYTFDTIGYLTRKGLLLKEDVQIFAFQASRVLHNPDVVKYLQWLDGEYENQGKPTPAHKDARWLVDNLT